MVSSLLGGQRLVLGGISFSLQLIGSRFFRLKRLFGAFLRGTGAEIKVYCPDGGNQSMRSERINTISVKVVIKRFGA